MHAVTGRSSRTPEPVAKLLILLLDDCSEQSGCSMPLIRPAAGTPRRYGSMFPAGLRDFTVFGKRRTGCLGFTFIPDTRFT
ncbi:MAG: hypothetical protein F9K27_14290 [Anaerolineae bacterium]|nr:MAG: hypothetical protein F9K27_14290 [Anaerolineae bacterium]